MRTDDFDFDLPADRIALAPASPRDSARLLVVTPSAVPVLRDAVVGDLAALLRPGDALVVNDTRVIPAALEGRRRRAGHSARIALTLLRRIDDARWRAFARPAKRLAERDVIEFDPALTAVVARRLEAGEVELAFDRSGPELDAAIRRTGRMPLPPYISLRRSVGPADAESYQTVYARQDGAVAAPTAGLHFTPRLLAAIEERGVSRHAVTLHVGAGTFLPVKADDPREHTIHAEWCEISAETAAALNAVRARGGRIVAAGTTSLRTLETATGADGIVMPYRGETSIFITPGYRFRCVDVLLTNFHLPRSTLFMLVAAFSGLEVMQAAYAHAISAGYRFYSYGDACLLTRA